jgi:hypothetical protein
MGQDVEGRGAIAATPTHLAFEDNGGAMEITRGFNIVDLQYRKYHYL